MAIRKADFKVPTLNGAWFTWTGKVGVVEESTLTGHFGNGWYGRVWRDGYDIAFEVRSPKTGASKLFVYSHARKTDEGELVARIFESSDGFTVHVLND